MPKRIHPGTSKVRELIPEETQAKLLVLRQKLSRRRSK